MGSVGECRCIYWGFGLIEEETKMEDWVKSFTVVPYERDNKSLLAVLICFKKWYLNQGNTFTLVNNKIAPS